MKKRKKQNIFTFLVLILAFVFLLLSNIRIYQKRITHLKMIDQLEEKKQELTEKEKELRYKIEQVHTQEHLEKIARKQLRLVRPGEQVVVIEIERKEPEKEPEKEKNFWNFEWLF